MKYRSMLYPLLTLASTMIITSPAQAGQCDAPNSLVYQVQKAKSGTGFDISKKLNGRTISEEVSQAEIVVPFMKSEGMVTINADKYCSPVSAHVVPSSGVAVAYHFCAEAQDKSPPPNRSDKVFMTYELIFACDKVGSDKRLEEGLRSVKEGMEEIIKGLDGAIEKFEQKK